MKKPIKRGDYFLMPYRGKRIDLLVRATRRAYGEYWYARHFNGIPPTMSLLSSCHRCPPSLAKRIIKAHT